MLNEIQFIGNLTKKPELRTVKKKNGEDTNVTTITIAVDRRKAGLPLDGTDFFEFTVWGKTAENCTAYLDKGSKVLIKGYVVINSSEKDGQKRFYTQFTAQRVIFLSKPNQNSGNFNIPKNEHITNNTDNVDSKTNINLNLDNVGAPVFNSGAFVPIDSDDIPF